jgi:cytochrome d ubiquinol oxidase subunit I
MITFTLLYGALAVVEVGLIWKFAKAGPPEITTEQADDTYASRDSDEPLTIAY